MLCGRQATDYSMASTTLLFDQRRQTWSDELLAVSGIDRRLLCEALPSGTVLGEVHAAAAEATGLPEGIPVVLGGHDYCCGALPTGAFRPGVVLDVLGTWEMVVTALPEPVLTPAVRRDGHPRRFARRPRRLDRHGRHGGRRHARMVRQDRFGRRGRRERRAASIGPASWRRPPHRRRGPTASSSSPTCPAATAPSSITARWAPSSACGTPSRRATCSGRSSRGSTTSSSQIVRGFESGLGVRPERIVAIGGPTRTSFWMQNKADVIGRPDRGPAARRGGAAGRGDAGRHRRGALPRRARRLRAGLEAGPHVRARPAPSRRVCRAVRRLRATLSGASRVELASPRARRRVKSVARHCPPPGDKEAPPLARLPAAC